MRITGEGRLEIGGEKGEEEGRAGRKVGVWLELWTCWPCRASFELVFELHRKEGVRFCQSQRDKRIGRKEGRNIRD
jgi:hypothetical protein